MPILTWDKIFELGVSPFDEDHKHLVGLINEIHDNLIVDASHDDLGAIIAKLIEYATNHFAAEENSMAFNDYSGLTLHREEHAKFCRMVVSVIDDFREGKNDLSLDVLSFLGNWLFDHILHTDAEYCQYLQDHQKSALKPF
jgi:hemerythrin